MERRKVRLTTIATKERRIDNMTTQATTVNTS